MDATKTRASVPFDATALPANDPLAGPVQALLARLRPPPRTERRLLDRTPLPFLLRLTPLDAAGEPLEEEAIVVVGRDVSSRGLGFFHTKPLACRRAIISFDHPTAGHFSAEVDLGWCRFTQLGWYESGGRLVRLVDRLDPCAARAG